MLGLQWTDFVCVRCLAQGIKLSAFNLNHGERVDEVGDEGEEGSQGNLPQAGDEARQEEVAQEGRC